MRITQFLSHSILIISKADRLSAEAKCRYSKTDGRRAAVGVLVRVKGCGRAGVDQSGNSSLRDTHRFRPPRHLGPAPSQCKKSSNPRNTRRCKTRGREKRGGGGKRGWGGVGVGGGVARPPEGKVPRRKLGLSKSSRPPPPPPTFQPHSLSLSCTHYCYELAPMKMPPTPYSPTFSSPPHPSLLSHLDTLDRRGATFAISVKREAMAVAAIVIHSLGSEDVSDVSSRPYFSSLIELNSLRSTDFHFTDFASLHDLAPRACKTVGPVRVGVVLIRTIGGGGGAS